MKEGLNLGRGEENKESKKEFAKALESAQSELHWSPYFKEEIPEMIDLLDTNGFKLKELKELLDMYTRESNLEKNKPKEERESEFTVLDTYVMKILYPVATAHYLKENKGGKLEEESPDISKMNSEEKNSIDVPLGARKGLQGNLVAELYYLNENEPNFFSEDIKKKILDYENLRKNTPNMGNKKENLKNEKERLENKLALEKIYFDLLFKQKIKIE